MSQNMLQVSSSHKDGITIHHFPRSPVSNRSSRYALVHPKLWDFIESKKVQEYEGKRVSTNIYYCNNCLTIFILPGWFTPYYKDPRRLLEKYLTCCSEKTIFFLIRKDDMDEQNIMIFEPFRPSVVWEIPDFWINTAVVADELL